MSDSLVRTHDPYDNGASYAAAAITPFRMGLVSIGARKMSEQVNVPNWMFDGVEWMYYRIFTTKQEAVERAKELQHKELVFAKVRLFDGGYRLFSRVKPDVIKNVYIKTLGGMGGVGNKGGGSQQIVEGQKVCSKCGELKSLTAFGKAKNVSTGYSSWCKHCWKLNQLYGIDHVQYNALLAHQNEVCAICGEPGITERWKYLFVDHDHTTGEVRGLLCHSCNMGLGGFRDNPDLMQKAIGYIMQPPQKVLATITSSGYTKPESC